MEDALNATRAAVEEGVVVGGGCALLYASQELDKVKVKGDDQKAGVDIIKKALQAPIRQIAANAGVDGSVVVGKLLEGKKATQGFDAQDEQYVDMFSKGVTQYKLVASLGATETYPFIGSSEIITDITSTGKTLKDNNLRILKDGLILKSQACVLYSKKKAAKLQPFLNSLK